MLKDLCFEVIQRCLNNCKFCSSNSDNQCSQIIEYIDFERTVRFFHKKYGIEEISLSGGEPFLHPNILDMVKLCKRLGIKTVIYTSGMVLSNTVISDYERSCDRLKQKYETMSLSDKTIKKAFDFEKRMVEEAFNEKYSSISNEILIELKEIGIDKLVFDFQALDVQINQSIMGNKDLFFKLVKSITRANNIGLNIDYHFIPTKLNYKQIEDIIEILDIYDNPHISILKFVPQGRGKLNKKELELSKEEYIIFFKLLNKAKSKYPKVKVRVGIPLTEEDTHLCTAGLSKLSIRYDGVILPCPAFKELQVGDNNGLKVNVYSIYDNLENIIISSGYRKFPLCKQILK